MKRTANARWKGSIKDGSGLLSAPGGALKDTPYSFATRFESANGTNPEELIAAAHAGCFSMALAFALGGAGHKVSGIDTTATLTMEQSGDGWSITAVHLDTVAEVPGIEDAAFQQVAAGAKANCPVSKVLKATITLSAKLRS